MIIDESNLELGEKAMMFASFFYYQLLEEGEFSCGQTSYWLFDECTCWELLDLQVVEPARISFGIDQLFIQEAALIYILCMLNNQFNELEPEYFPKQDDIIFKTIRAKGLCIIPELSQVLEFAYPYDFKLFNDAMDKIFKLYVRARFARLIGQG